MNTASLLKRGPILIMVVCLAYACYKIHAIVPDSSAGRNDLAKGLDVMVNDALQAGASEVQSLTRAALRDPFRIRPRSVLAPEAHEAAADPENDPLAGLVGGLSLDATFLQGKAQIAIINGRMYHKGEHLVLQGDAGKSFSPLYVESVRAHRVTLVAHHTRYELGYPDKLGSRPADRGKGGPKPVDGSLAEIDPEGELAFYKRLLNSPLGKLGKSLTGRTDAGAARAKAGKSRNLPWIACCGEAAPREPELLDLLISVCGTDRKACRVCVAFPGRARRRRPGPRGRPRVRPSLLTNRQILLRRAEPPQARE